MPPRHRALSLLLAVGVGVLLVAAAQSLPQGPSSSTTAQTKLKINRSVPNLLDWPMLGRTPSRTPVQPKTGKLPSDWNVKTGKNVKWSVPLGSQAYGGPVIADGKVFVGTNNGQPRNRAINGDKGVLMCFRESDGAFLWQALHDKLPTGRVQDWPEQGVASTPCVDGDRVYYMSNRCELICADVEGMANGNQGVQDEVLRGPQDADIIWRLDLIKELGVFPHNLAASAPLVMDGVVYVVTGNGHDLSHEHIPAPSAPSFLAVDKKTGRVLWQDNSPGKNILHGQWTCATWMDVNGKPQVIFPGGDGWLRAFEPKTGKLIWKFDANPKDAVHKLGGRGTRNFFIAPAVVYQGKLYVTTAQDPEHGDGIGHLWCIDPSKARPDNVDLSPRDKKFDPKAPENRDSGLVWHFGGEDEDHELVFRRSLSMCAISDNLLFVTAYAGYIYCLDARIGKQYWVYDALAEIWGGPMIADGKVYVGTEEGDVLVFDAGRACRLIATNDMSSSITGAGAVAANNMLYIMTKNRLYALTEQAKK